MAESIQGAYATIQGPYAAIITPRTATGAIDETALGAWLELLIARGIQGFAINGATGEFCLTTLAEFDRLISFVAGVLRGKARFLAGIGAAGSHPAIQMGRLAGKAGAEALLLPMPCFFPYAQDDLKTFSLTVAAAVEAPILLYNLPQFTSGLEPQTSLELIRDCDSIIGIKDSSGSLATLRLLTQNGVPARRIIGNDGALEAALREQVADAVVSGVACVLPELIGQIWQAGTTGAHDPAFLALVAALNSFIAELDRFPTPWGLKVAAEARGLAPATFPFPISHEREQQRHGMIKWFAEHSAALHVS